jgi:starch synthase (maltosyl-transferring)
VRVFRVDNPHTKPVPFWEWLVAEVRACQPELVLLGGGVHAARDDDHAREGRLLAVVHVLHVEEHALGAEEFVEQLLAWSDFYRPNFFANTPDILHEYLQDGGRPRSRRGSSSPRRSARVRHLLRLRALRERARAAGSEEYLDSEKYEAEGARARRAAAAARRSA